MAASSRELLIAVGVYMIVGASCSTAPSFPSDEIELLLQGPVSAPTSGSRVFTVDATESTSAFVLGQEVGYAVPSGTVGVVGGDCQTASCAITITDLDVVVSDFALGDAAVSNTQFSLIEPIPGQLRADTNTFILDRTAVDIRVVGSVDGQPHDSEYSPQDNIAGTLNLDTGRMVFWVTVYRR